MSPDGDVIRLPHSHPATEDQRATEPDVHHRLALLQASEFEALARRASGPGSLETAHWARVHQALQTGPVARALTEVWIATLEQASTEHPKTRAWARDAFRCWKGITDPQQAVEIGGRLLAAFKCLRLHTLTGNLERWITRTEAFALTTAKPVSAATSEAGAAFAAVHFETACGCPKVACGGVLSGSELPGCQDHKTSAHWHFADACSVAARTGASVRRRRARL